MKNLPGEFPNLKMTALFLHRGLSGLPLEACAHAVPLGRPRAVLLPGADMGSRTPPNQDPNSSADGNASASTPTSAISRCAESTPNPGVSARRRSTKWAGGATSFEFPMEDMEPANGTRCRTCRLGSGRWSNGSMRGCAAGDRLAKASGNAYHEPIEGFNSAVDGPD
jgi:hypothetical protein